MQRKIFFTLFVPLIFIFAGCSKDDGRTVIEIMQYKPETANYFKQVEQEFNDAHSDIRLVIQSPNDASTVLKTRFIREDPPDIIGIGGDINYSYYVDAEILADISDYKGLDNIKQAYKNINKMLEIVPAPGVYGVPYMANAAGVLYNRDIFAEHGYSIPNTYAELKSLCNTMIADGVKPFVFGFRDDWTCLAPWNAIAVCICPPSTPKDVNAKKTTFAAAYKKTAEQFIDIIKTYGDENTMSYGYNDACTAFARGQAAMYTIGSYAVPQIMSVNPALNVDSFTMPSSDDGNNVLNSGIDLQFCVTQACRDRNKIQAAYEVLDFLLDDDNLQKYVDNQNAIPCKEGNFRLSPAVDGMGPYIKSGKMADYQDHYYPSEMNVAGMLNGYIAQGESADDFLKRFDTAWVRYNRDIIQEVEKYQRKHGAQ